VFFFKYKKDIDCVLNKELIGSNGTIRKWNLKLYALLDKAFLLQIKQSVRILKLKYTNLFGYFDVW